MSELDIIARLELRGEQFSSEVGQRFAEMKTRAQSTAQETRQAFSGAFAEVQKLAANALTIPRNAGGALDLSSEIAQLRQAESAAENNAQAHREMSIALTSASGAAGVDARALRLEADAAAVATLASEREAQAIRDRVVALEAVQTELNRTTSATRLNTGALEQAGVSAGQRRAALQQLGFQFNDVATQAASGTKATIIFAQQSGQFVQALQMMSGSTQGFLGWLGGWQGALASAVVIGSIPFIAKLIEGGDALTKESDKLRENAEKAAVARDAKALFARTEAGLLADVNELTDALKRQNDALRSNAEQVNYRAKQDQEKAENKLADQTKALADARTALATVQAGAPDTKGLGGGNSTYLAKLGAAQAEVAALENSVAVLRKALAGATAARLESQRNLAAETAKRLQDPSAQIDRKYDAADDGLIALAKKHATAEDVVNGVLTRRLDLLEKQRKAELKAESDRQSAVNRKVRTPSLGDQIDTERGRSILSDAQRYTGLREDTARGRSGLSTLFGGAGISVDPEKQAWCAAFVNAVLAGRGLGGTGSLAARSFLGYGSNTERPEKGDIVVLKGNRGAGSGHVGFYAGAGANGSVMVTGGNQGNAVSTQSFRRSDVLGFRRAPSAADAYRDEQKGERALDRQEDAADRVREAIARINSTWDEQPRLIDKASAGTRSLNAIIDEYGGKADAVSQKIVADARAALAGVVAGTDKPFQDYLQAQRESAAVQSLLIDGREVEARALQDALQLQRQGKPLTDDRLRTVLATAEAEERASRAIEAQRRELSLYSGAADDLQHTFDQFLGDLERRPGKAFKGLVSGLIGDFRSLQNGLLSNQLFGGLDQELQDFVKGHKADPANDEFARRTKRAGSSLDALSDALDRTTGRVSGVGAFNDPLSGLKGRDVSDLDTFLRSQPVLPDIGRLLGGLPANDNQPVAANTQALHSAADAFNFMGGRLVDRFEGMFGKLPKNLEDGLKKNLGTVLQGASNGMFAGSTFASITGGKSSPLGSAIGGALGQEAGKELGKGLTGFLGKAAGPLGGIAGGILGNLVGGLLAKTKKGSSTLAIENGGIVAGAATGNSASYRAAASGLAGNVGDALTQIASSLGGSIGGAISVSIGKRKDNFVVDTTGQGKTKGAGTQSFATEEAATRAAIADALSDGAIQGISDASKRILSSGQKLEIAIEKAAMIEAIPKQLAAMLDPVGAALDELNAKWVKTIAALDEGGASAEQRADAEKLYRLQLAETKASTAEASASLKDFLKSLSLGSNSPLSLRDQEGTAKDALQPFLTQIAGGERVDQAKYQEAAQAYLDIERQLYGSTEQYFAAFSDIQAATARAISSIDNAVPIREATPDPFARATADNTSTANELLSQISEQLRGIAAAGGFAPIEQDNDFIGASRGFAINY